MTRLLLIPALFGALAACTCCSPPTSSQKYDLDAIKKQYVAAQQVEADYFKLPWCTVPPLVRTQCATGTQKQKVRLADYNASSALLIAEAQQDDSSIRTARTATAEFTKVTDELPNGVLGP